MSLRRFRKWWILLAPMVLYAVLHMLSSFLGLGSNRPSEVPLPEGGIPVPHERTLPWMDASPLTQELVEDWASKGITDWKKDGKVGAPRILLAKLALNREVPEVNAYLASQVPWGRPGSKWPLHPDYDFTLVPLTTILYLFGDRPDILYPATREHMLSELLVEEGPPARTRGPWTLGLLRDTENHLLMREGSRYLKNRWLWLHVQKEKRFNNEENGLERWMLRHLKGLEAASFHEFNSMPYSGYTLTALLNLEAFGSDAVRLAARDLLDRVNWNYALGSLGYRRFPPFRRRYEHAKNTTLGQDYQTALVKIWMSLRPGNDVACDLTDGRHHALLASLLPYRLPDKTVQWIEAKPCPYLVRIGHGPKACPEIYFGGPGYLLSAGGVHRGLLSNIVARPITLLLDDQAQDLKDVVHLAGPGPGFRNWNDTGVLENLACAAGPVSVPAGWTPVCQDEGWALYQPSPGLSVAVWTSKDFGLVAMLPGKDPAKALQDLCAANPEAARLRTSFHWPAGPRIEYDVLAPRSLWVMKSVANTSLDRDHAAWPLLDGRIETPPEPQDGQQN